MQLQRWLSHEHNTNEDQDRGDNDRHSRRDGPMLKQVADGVLTHQSELLQNNAVVVQGRAGVLLIDPGIQGDEMACLANDLRRTGPARCGRLLDAS